MILSASAGTGHIRAAQAVEEACRKDGRVSETLNVDALSYTNLAFQRLYSKGYLEAIKTIPDIWAWAFEATDKPWKKPYAVTFAQKINSQPLVKKIKDFRPDVCICTHGMPAEIISRMIQRDRIQTNLGIVVTDYYVHALWLMDVFTRYFVSKEESRAHLNLLGIPSDRIVVSGIPVLEAFAADGSRETLRGRYGFDPRKLLVLLSAGAFGVMSAADIMKILAQIKTPCRIVVVCGKNERLRKGLEAFATAPAKEDANDLTVVGYTDAMHEYLKMADVFIGKPGGLSSSECLAAGVPMVIWDPIPGQEVYNCNHIIEHGAGVIPDNALTIGFKVDEMLSDPQKLKRMGESAIALSRPRAATAIVDAMLANPDETPVKAFKKRG